MPRPLKKGLAYWNKDVNFYADPKVRKIGRRKGAAGQAILDCILCKIYREGYFLTIDDDLIEDISDETFTTPELVFQVIELAVEVGFFHEGFWKNNATLTGLSLQSAYFSATSRRQKPNSDLQYFLLSGINANNNDINADNNEVIVDNNSENKIIRNNPIYSSSYSSIVDREKEEEIFLIFFLKNVKDFRAEYRKFVKFYSDRGWNTPAGQPVSDVIGLARAWSPHDTESHFNERALTMLAEINNELRTRGYKIQDRCKLLDAEAVWFEGATVRIKCSETLHAFMEENISEISPVIYRYGRTLSYDLKQ